MNVLRPTTILNAVGGSWLRAPGSDAPIASVSIDSRDAQRGTLFIAIRGETHDGHDFVEAAAKSGAAVVLIERELALNALPNNVGVMRVNSTRAALMQLAAWYRSTLTKTKVIAVTGSAGKTTTRQLILSALSAQWQGIASPKSFNNDIGVPLSLLLVRPEHDFAVIEVGINAVSEMQPLADIIRPDIVVITNIGDSHLEGLQNIETVAREKLRLSSTLATNGIAVLHADSSMLRKQCQLKNVIWFGESPDAMVRLVDRAIDGQRQQFTLADGSRFQLALAGRHSAINALAAIAVARHMGATDDAINRGLATATGPPMRMELQTIGPLQVLNDSYNANPQSMLAGIDAFLEMTSNAARRILVLGDMRELGSAGPALHQRVGSDIAARLAKHPCTLYCIGTLTTNALAPALHSPVETHPELTPVVADCIAAQLQPGDAVFIKGSRAMALERLISAIARRFTTTKPAAHVEAVRPVPAQRHVAQPS